MLDEGRCAVSALPAGRWRAERYQHPRKSEPGFSYTFDGGYIADPLGFDPIVFGISPREAAEMDPQQRLLLETVWGALEDAGIPPSALAGANVGVYVGASGLDYGNLHSADPAAIESHFMTGNTLSILSNRISYIYDLRGPSFTVDTACSSSLVAFAEAQAAIASGRIDMAIVAGVNLLMSPTSFIGFSRASMLSPTGLCRPFSADADGYVRGEGAVAMLLARVDVAVAGGFPVRAVALASGINSDGRTNGISLPATEGQRELLDRLYGGGMIDPNRLAFVEAHGTGTRVGDPAEAMAIGEALGQRRDHPLPIGSVKSNIGHLEPASGLAGLLKAILALEHRKLPASLHSGSVNPAIDFAELNLALATEAVDLPATGTWLAGVSSFGFGGTNAHVVIRQPLASEMPQTRGNGLAGGAAELLMLSGHSRQALTDTAAAYATMIEAGADAASLAAAVAWQRDSASHRVAVPVAEAAGGLRVFAETGTGTVGTAPSATPQICFVYAGNGCQWAGMGRAAFAQNPAFRRHFTAVDTVFRAIGDWSLTEALHDDGLAARLKQTRIAQPLLFAVQSALTASLAELGLQPDMVLGHSVGEVAAAEAAGALSLAEAVRVIFHRSEHQEAAHGMGGMAAANMSAEDAAALIAEHDLAGVEVAAINGPGAVTLSGPVEAIQRFSRLGRQRRVAVRVLDLAYPFHSGLLEPLRQPLLESLGDVASAGGRIPFISTVTGGVMQGAGLDAEYWWRNVREPVRFRAAVAAAAERGATVFVEIGSRPILNANIADTLRDKGQDGTVIASLLDKDRPGDPLLAVAARAVVLGAPLDRERVFGHRPVGRVKLPPYAWQRKAFQQPATSEAMDLYADTPRHPLIGARLQSGTPEWRNLIDPAVVPYLADHRIDGQIVMPGTGLAEMALAVAREMFPEGPVGLEDFDLLQWLPLQPDAMRELSIRLAGDTQVVEIWSRPRLGADEWILHARGRITQIAAPVPAFIPRVDLPTELTAHEIYDAADAVGVTYGPSFRRVTRAARSEVLIEADLSAHEEGAGLYGRKQILHPIALDAAFHAMFENIKPRLGERYAYLPVRFAGLRVEQDHAIPARARVSIDRETDQSISLGVTLYDAEGRFIAGLTGGLFRAVVLARHEPPNMLFQQTDLRLLRDDSAAAIRERAVAALASDVTEPPESWLFLGAFARSLSHRALQAVYGADPALPADGLPLSLFQHLAQAGLATETESGWQLADSSGLPAPGDILRTFAAEYAGATPEIVLAAQALAGLEDMLATGQGWPIRAALQEQFESSAMLFQPVLDAALRVSEALQARIAPEPLRVLIAEPHGLGLLHRLAPLVREGRAVITVLGVDAKRVNHMAARFGAQDGILFATADAEPGAAFDVAFGFAFGPLFGGDPALGRAIARRLAPSGLFCALQPPDNPIFDLLLGTGEDWFTQSAGRVAVAQDGSRIAIAAGFRAPETHALGDGLGSMLLAHPDPAATAADAAATPVIVLQDVAGVSRALRADGRVVLTELAWPGIVTALADDERADVVFAAGSDLDHAIVQMTAILTTVQAGQCRLWVVVQGLQSGDPALIDPAAEAIWDFARVAANEYAGVEVKRVGMALDVPADIAGRRLADLIAAPGAEDELLIDAQGLSATRIVAGAVASRAAVPAVKLQRSAKGALADFDWVAMQRRAPGPGEVEIEIQAAGLNFRDVMLANGLLDDDVLDDGLAGAVFGFECAGRVVRVGDGVSHLQPGDLVMGFGRESFASHSTADARVFTRVPDGIGADAAATIPVAFLTAWYSLVHQAQIQPGEWVLIHGAAGGVGLAAIQIARMRGAHVAATVSAPDKRALVTLFGAEKIYNSRSLAFLDEIRAEIGGVDVVLNSLAGDAMQASIKCLKPFGRFVEMGKRDYVLNTAMGLRPFRRNLSYFGVDLDQLLAANLPLASRLMGDLVAHFATGDFSPLPHRAFDWYDTGKAFQLMQGAGHVGKLIVRPAAASNATAASTIIGR